MLLDAYRVLDLTNHRGQLCGKVLAELGADVVKVEPPGGDPSRRHGPFLDDDPSPEKSLPWLAYNTSKRSVTLDIEGEKDREKFLELVKDARFLIESFLPGYLDDLGLSYETLSGINPSLIMVSITPFGRTGPYAGLKDSDLINMGMGGHMTICGDTDRAPLRFTAEQSYPLAGMHAATASLAAHYYREKTGFGQHIDVSIQESVLLTSSGLRIHWEMHRFLEKREGSRMARGVVSFRNFWRCQDGMVCWRLFTASLGKWTQALVDWMKEEGCADYLADIPWTEVDMGALTQEEIDRFEAPFEGFFLRHTKNELFEESLKRVFVLFPLSTTRDLLENEQLNARGLWRDVRYPALDKTIKHPGLPYHIPEIAFSVGHPPTTGEHNREILGNEGLSAPPDSPPGPSGPGNHTPPLDGLKVLDLSWVIAGPLSTKGLANLGATVVRVESEQRLDFLRAYPPFPEGVPGVNRSGVFSHLNDGKYGIALNYKHPRAREVMESLVRWADVVVENFTPGTMERMGFPFEDLRRMKHDIIMFRASMMGQTGPYAHATGLGTMLQAYAGFSHLIGWPDRMPVGTAAAYTDYPAAGFSAIGVLAALDYRRRTGKGICIDMSQLEAAQQLLLPALLDYTANGRVWEALGNRHPEACPHGAYPCRGDDRWTLIAVFDERTWGNLKAAMGNPDWAEREVFSSLESRKSNEDDLDRHVSAWTSQYPPEEVMERLQASGVPAGMVKNGKDLFEDPQLEHRENMVWVEHQEMGLTSCNKPPFRFSHTPFRMEMPSPCVGEHTELVCREFLNMSDEAFFELLSDGVFE